MAQVQVFRSILKHPTGAQWLRQSNAWSIALAYCLEGQTVYVVREATQFITDFVFKVATEFNDDEFLIETLRQITMPMANEVVVIDGTVSVDSSGLQRRVRPSLDLLCHLSDHLIRSEYKTNIPEHILKTTGTKMNLWRMTDKTLDPVFFKLIMHTIVFVSYLEFVDNLAEPKDKVTLTLAHNQFGLHFFNHMKFCLLHRNPCALLSIAKLYHVLWNTLGTRAPEEIELESKKIKFENQIIILQLMPIIFSIQKPKAGQSELEIFDTYIMKLFDISTDHTMRICYAYRDLMMTYHRSKMSTITAKAIQGILAMKSVLHRDRAVYVFQAMSYCLKAFADADTVDDTNVEMQTDVLIEMPNLLSALLTGLHTLVKDYRITWKESIESACLLNFMLVLLNRPNLTMTVSADTFLFFMTK